jgi:hypothetical protein
VIRAVVPVPVKRCSRSFRGDDSIVAHHNLVALEEHLVQKGATTSRGERRMNSRTLTLLILTTFAVTGCAGPRGKKIGAGGSGGTEETGGTGGSITGTGGRTTTGGSGGSAGGSGGAGTGGAAAGASGTGGARDASADQASTSPDGGAVPAGGDGVLTRGYHNDRTGANLNETILDAKTVGGGNFGKLFCRPVDDEIYGQLLYVPALEVAGAKHNVVIAVTMNDSVYAYDADDRMGAPLWERHFADPAKGITPVPAAELSPTTCGVYKDVSRQIGILSTPVIDGASKTIYLVARTKESGKYFQRFVALDLLTGADSRG